MYAVFGAKISAIFSIGTAELATRCTTLPISPVNKITFQTKIIG
jgi:hypothetical protein